MGNALKDACDSILDQVTQGQDRVPGVVAMITDRQGDIYSGARGERNLGTHEAMQMVPSFQQRSPLAARQSCC